MPELNSLDPTWMPSLEQGQVFVTFQRHDPLGLFGIVVRHLRRKSSHGVRHHGH